MKRLFYSCVILFFMFSSVYSQTQTKSNATIQQSVEMLNYISTLSERIKTNKSNRLELNEIRDEIYNNIIPLSIDETTQKKITGDNGFLDTIQEFTLIGLQRDRIEYIAQKQKTQALQAAVPNPVYILSITQSGNPYQIAVSLVSTVASSFMNYESVKQSQELQIMQQSWELDDKEYDKFEDCRKETFDYMIEISRKYHLPQEYTLSEQNIKDFVLLMNDTNLSRRLSELIKNDNKRLYTSAHYGPYYIGLTETYYELQKYAECIKTFQEYENKQSRIFRKDYDAARVIPKVIYSAEKIYNSNDYTIFANQYLEKLITETTDKNWDLRYFVALTYYKLAELNPQKKSAYLEKARRIILDTISYLAGVQKTELKEYLAPISTEVPKEVIRPEDIKSYKKLISQKEKDRATATIPLNDSFFLCCKLFYFVNNEYPLSKKEYKEKFLDVINDALLNQQLRHLMSFDKNGYNIIYLNDKFTSDGFRISTDKTKEMGIWRSFANLLMKATNDISVFIPANYIDPSSRITLKFQSSNSEPIVLKNIDFTIKKIIRNKDFNSSTSEQIANSINMMYAEIEFNTKSYNLNIRDYDTVAITIDTYNSSITFTSENPDVQKTIEKEEKVLSKEQKKKEKAEEKKQKKENK